MEGEGGIDVNIDIEWRDVESVEGIVVLLQIIFEGFCYVWWV